MRTYIADIIPKIQQFSRKLDDLTRLKNQHWVSIGEISDSKTVFIFRDNNQLLISENGKVQKCSWEYLGNQSLLIETKTDTLLFKHGFFDENVIALKLDSNDRYAFFINETKYGSELNSFNDIVKFLSEKYLSGKTIPSEHFSYTIIKEEDKFNLVSGSHRIYTIKFGNGEIDRVYKGKSTGKFYFINVMTGYEYCSGLEDAIKRLWYHRKQFKTG